MIFMMDAPLQTIPDFVIPAMDWPESSAREGILDSGFCRNNEEAMSVINGTVHQ
ncbi:MAG: hypothetical protein ACREVE_16410 [Gammaproteobacteria bacterium]